MKEGNRLNITLQYMNEILCTRIGFIKRNGKLEMEELRRKKMFFEAPTLVAVGIIVTGRVKVTISVLIGFLKGDDGKYKVTRHVC